ncbi:MAG: family 20 glycosylhydrolase [Ignavibacteriae bacterium]|nr:family 20 glycosylhydrolase [Ignavibacteriota bacterium]
MNSFKKFFFVLLLVVLPSFVYPQNPCIIPDPVKFELKAGSFEINENTVISANCEEAFNDAVIFKKYIKDLYGLNLRLENSRRRSNCIYIEYVVRADIPEGSYELNVNQFGVEISGMTYYHGLQSLKQMILKAKGTLIVPNLYILDYPRYSYRGMHLDVCRHFFPKDFVKRYIDFLAMYKMNYFHWHLTDDQAWRIEIKKYPKLTEIGAWRKGVLTGRYKDVSRATDTVNYGGYFTQDDVREIVKYAEERHITVIPEIEMPGHSLAALTGYPEYSCTGGPFEVAREWGVFDDIFCPKEETFKFLEDVLSEVAELFPGRYIHIGGDEAPKDRWKNCKHCQELIKKEGLKDEHELQSYFIKRIEKFLNSKGKAIIGWDEILDGGLAPNATVMSWRGTEGGIEAAKQNHNVIMTPGEYCYFDHYQSDPRNEPIAIGGYTTLEKVYSFEPTPKELTEEQQKYILGAQANVWTEYIIEPMNVEYMVFPRICALSEVLWTPAGKKNNTDFKDRLKSHFKLLDLLKINYSKAVYDLSVKYSQPIDKKGIGIEVNAPFSNSEIYYTTDGSEPDLKSIKYSGIFSVLNSCTIKTAYFENGNKQGNTFVQEFNINLATGQNITLVTQPRKRYSVGGAFSLVDGITGRLPWSGRDWLGFLGDDLNATIELKQAEEISKVVVDVLNSEQNWIYLPKEIEVFVSTDGIKFESVKKVEWNYINKYERSVELTFDKVKTKYVKVIARNFGKIPAGNPGEGTDAWLFVDEISIE